MVGGVVLAAAAALDQLGLGALGDCQCAVIDPLLDERLPLLLHLVAGHLSRRHHGQPLSSYTSLKSKTSLFGPKSESDFVETKEQVSIPAFEAASAIAFPTADATSPFEPEVIPLSLDEADTKVVPATSSIN